MLAPREIKPRARAPGSLEADIERAVVEYAEARGFWQSKFSAPNWRSVPDRMFVEGIFCFFIEFKRPGAAPTPAQKERHREMLEHGALVFVVDDVARGKELIDAMRGRIDAMKGRADSVR